MVEKFNVLKQVKTKLGNDIVLLGNNPSALIIGIFHGDEPQGKFLIENYINNPVQPCSALFIPCLNPDGLAAGTRTNANGVDLNRNFPAANWELTEKNEFFGGETPGSEIETQFLMDVIKEYKPKTILALHAPLKAVNYDGPAQEAARKISEIINYPAAEDIGYPTPGSFGTWAGVERGIPVITLELDDKCPAEDLIEPFRKILLSL
ncbi:MAG: DUF2817 domain-containing protein [Heliobacteriaceae bacterium]|jgi:protein MpaA|nr:DUF2817 domain-containing protein [Heliobacteriaceae bacterium]